MGEVAARAVASAGAAPALALSARSARARRPMLSYAEKFRQARLEPYTESSPDGYIICSVAENKLCSEMLHARLAQVPPPPASVLHYPTSYRGTPDARAAMAHLMQRAIMRGVQVDPANLVLLSGAGAVLDVLFWCLCDPGDVVFIPGPIYPAFISDLTTRDDACPVVTPPLCEQRSVAEQLDAWAGAQAASGRRVRAVLLTNPNNPCGTMYARSTLVELVRWCARRGCHLVCDEIYALSVWGAHAPEFVSAEALAPEAAAGLQPDEAARIPELLHIVWGMSKDFGASGLRVGVLHTRNSELVRATETLGYLSGVSVHTQWLIEQVLMDDAFVDAFIAENKRRMRASYELLCGALDAAGIPHLPASAAMFCWIDLGQWLSPGRTWEAEAELWDAMFEAKVLFTPGEACKAERPGFFRICWAWVPPSALPVGVARLKRLLDARKQT